MNTRILPAERDSTPLVRFTKTTGQEDRPDPEGTQCAPSICAFYAADRLICTWQPPKIDAQRTCGGSCAGVRYTGTLSKNSAVKDDTSFTTADQSYCTFFFRICQGGFHGIRSIRFANVLQNTLAPDGLRGCCAVAGARYASDHAEHAGF